MNNNFPKADDVNTMCDDEPVCGWGGVELVCVFEMIGSKKNDDVVKMDDAMENDDDEFTWCLFGNKKQMEMECVDEMEVIRNYMKKMMNLCKMLFLEDGWLPKEVKARI